MCGGMENIQSATAENKKKRRRMKKEETTAAEYNALPYRNRLLYVEVIASQSGTLLRKCM